MHGPAPLPSWDCRDQFHVDLSVNGGNSVRRAEITVVHRWRRLESIVQAGVHNIAAEACVGAGDRSAAAEVNIKIFELRRPRAGQRRLDAAADYPAGFGGIAGFFDLRPCNSHRCQRFQNWEHALAYELSFGQRLARSNK